MNVDDLAAKRVLMGLAETDGIAFVSSRGAVALAGAAAQFLLNHEDEPDCAAQFSEWLIEQVEVADLFADDEAVAAILAEEWTSRNADPSPAPNAHDLELEDPLE